MRSAVSPPNSLMNMFTAGPPSAKSLCAKAATLSAFFAWSQGCDASSCATYAARQSRAVAENRSSSPLPFLCSEQGYKTSSYQCASDAWASGRSLSRSLTSWIWPAKRRAKSFAYSAPLRYSTRVVFLQLLLLYHRFARQWGRGRRPRRGRGHRSSRCPLCGTGCRWAYLVIGANWSV